MLIGLCPCAQAVDEEDNLVGVVVSKLEPHRGGPLRGYVAMLAVREEYRGKGIATKLVRKAIDAMIERDADEVRSRPPRWSSATGLFKRHIHILTTPSLRFKDRLRNRNHQHSSHQTLRTARLLKKQAAAQILPQWELSFPACFVPKGRRQCYSCDARSIRQLKCTADSGKWGPSSSYMLKSSFIIVWEGHSYM